MHMSEDTFSQCFLWIKSVAWGQCELVVCGKGRLAGVSNKMG